ncbi:TetR/AcrR family transcriptional regulator [Chitinophaga sp. GCM10012297]|uniref:TetR/AcrR family transcriptional regulator n=1 Tax=Chitinophaga chungangae TaxID=2821488 RepID=A0ABS3YC69_9BACT|nr:TetR/AcrR family transcriptional regulator [Chitinophaga chungangae]MBO9152282.1 TetR/AcrR family transcriptional regulator [Chitinophaga chungangae]
MTKAERTRQFIIEQSAVLMNKKTMAGTSMSDIMEATKLAKGGIYGNFESKEEICLEAFNYLAGKLADRLDAPVTAGKTAKEKFFNLLDTYRVPRNEGGCPLLNFGMEADDTNPEIKERVRKAILSAQKRISRIVTNGIAKGELSPSFDAKRFGIKAFAMIEGAVLCRKVTGNMDATNIVLEDLKKEFETYLL